MSPRPLDFLHKRRFFLEGVKVVFGDPIRAALI